MKLIIKWALYWDGESILRPHFTGDYSMVDCTEYLTQKQFKDRLYPDDFHKDKPFITYNWVKYYEGEVSPCHTEKLELLSDLSSLEFYDETKEFND